VTKGDKNGQQLSPKQILALPLVLEGNTDDQVAQAVGVKRQTVNEWRNRDPRFRAEVNRQQNELFRGTRERLERMTEKATRVLDLELERGSVKAAIEFLKLTRALDGVKLGQGGPETPRAVLEADAASASCRDPLSALEVLDYDWQKRRQVLQESLDEWGLDGDGS